MSRLKSLLPEHYPNVLYNLSYEDIINTCKSGGIIDVCNEEHLKLWWDKIVHDIEEVNQPYFDLYAFLNAALNLGQHLYLKAAMKYYDENSGDDLLRSDPTLIYQIFFQYGFITDDEEIMKNYVVINNKWLRDYYKLGVNLPEFEKIIKKGYYTLDEYYDILSKVLINANLEDILLIKNISMSFNLHPRRHKFDILIWKYIGFSVNADEKEKDIMRFRELVDIYKTYILNPKYFYNLIYDTYILDTIDDRLRKFMYPKINFTSEMWIFDDIHKFVARGRAQYVDVGKMLINIKLDENYKDLVYDNGHIQKYLLDNIDPNVLNYTLLYFFVVNLRLDQFKRFFDMVGDDYFSGALREFIISLIDHSKYAENVIEKIQFLLKHNKLKEETIQLLMQSFKAEYAGNISNPHLMIFFADEFVRRIMKKHKYKISVGYKEGKTEYKLYQQK